MHELEGILELSSIPVPEGSDNGRNYRVLKVTRKALNSEDVADQFNEEVCRYLDKKSEDYDPNAIYCIDMNETNTFSSSLIGYLIRISLEHRSEFGESISLTNLSKHDKEVIAKINVEKMFKIYSTLEDFKEAIGA
ncbi:hypothetical protein CMI42_03420 [Candidatus Pacearchaeota archaeon]|nr:hypothetical protein [Candidatus Pacearchaeota archaeon]|tara:strand:+ start:39 stop:446 length:408 start_codon:yes stop_codon:yes gene_type:complete